MKRPLKAARAWRPFNGPATVATRTLSRLTQREFDAAIKHLPRSGPVRSTLPNGEVLRLWSRGDDWISNQVFWRGWRGYEPETTPLFFHLARQAELVIDVGAYVGFFSLLAGLANRRGRVFAFEPMTDNAERLRRHITLNRLDNVELVPAAVSALSGSAELFHLGGAHPSSTSLVRDFMSSHLDVQSSVVPTVALDSFLAERGRPSVSLVKLDIETGEPDALRGMSETLERDRPAIFCEVLSADVGAQLQAILAPLGYRFYHLTPEGPLECGEVLSHPEWLNYLCALTRPDQLGAVVQKRRRGQVIAPELRRPSALSEHSVAGATPSDGSGPAVSITLLVWNALPGLRDSLRSIEPEVVSGFAEVIAVDNASPDESVQVVEAVVPQARVIRTEANLGFGGGVNRSWPYVRGRYWLLLNPDATFSPGGLRELVAWMDDRPEVGVASPGIGDLDGANTAGTPRALPSASLVIVELLRLHKLLPARLRGRIFQGPYWTGGDTLGADWVPGTAMIVRREAVEQAGLPDPSFFLYGEDIEWCWRIRRGGWAVGYCSGVVVRHEGSASNLRSYGRADTLLRMARTEIEAVSRARGPLRARLYGAATVVALAVESIHPRRSKDARAGNRVALRAWRRATFKRHGSLRDGAR